MKVVQIVARCTFMRFDTMFVWLISFDDHGRVRLVAVCLGIGHRDPTEQPIHDPRSGISRSLYDCPSNLSNDPECAKGRPISRDGSNGGNRL
jgi:hypothetical protein